MSSCQLQDKVFLIVGASGGIGSSLAKRLASSGSMLMLCGRSQEKLAILAKETGGECTILDATAIDQVEAAASATAESFGRLDGVVNCAGSLLLKPAHLTSEAEWNQTISSNLTTAFTTLRAGAKAMQKTGGSIVLVSSAAARTGFANHEAIAAAKAGVIGLTLSAAATYARRGIRVNCVAPGLVETPLTSRITGNEAALKGSAAMHALGRAGQASEVASAIAWLLDPEQCWVTGQVLGVDGGLGSIRPH